MRKLPCWVLVVAWAAGCGGSGGTAADPGPLDLAYDVAFGDTAQDGTAGDAEERDLPADTIVPDLPGDPAVDEGAEAAQDAAQGDDTPAGDAAGDPSLLDPAGDPAVDPADDPGADGPLDVAADVLGDAADLPPDAFEEPWTSLFDPARIRDASTAECLFTNPHTAIKDGVLLDVWNVSYRSWESIDGQLQPILIRGFAARPQVASVPLPGVVQAHGLGGMSEEAHATGTAALLGTFAIAYTGPGGGNKPDNTSEGRPAGYEDGYRMFDTLADPRGSWFWGHAVAGLRGLTCLAMRDDVDATRLGMTGFSAGGVVTLIGAAVDDRVKAAVPLSACGAWDVATQSPKAWQHELLAKAGLTTASPEWTALLDHLDSARLLPATAAQVLMVNGSADEFFPLTAHVATFDAIPGDAKRTAVAGNFDHGCFQLTSIEDKEDVEIRASDAAKGGQRMWFRHVFGTDADYGYVPLAPANVTFAQALPGAWIAGAVVDGGGSRLDVKEVRLWASTDAKLWFSLELVSKGNGLYATKANEFVPQDPATLAWYVDAAYKTKDLVLPETFSISTRPSLPAGFVPDIRGITSCW